MKCNICGAEIKGHGNNSAPIYEGTCCDRCNMEVVIPARLKIFKLRREVKKHEKD